MTGLAVFRLPSFVSLRALALLSVALNLFLGAMLIASRHPPGPPPYRPMPDRFVERIAPDLSDGDAARLRAAFEPQRARFAALSEEYRVAGRAVRALLETTPFDPQALRAATETARAKRRQISELTEETVFATLPNLSQAGRVRLIGSGRGG
jgi:Spy/CpxP family protein refolding chaperone